MPVPAARSSTRSPGFASTADTHGPAPTAVLAHRQHVVGDVIPLGDVVEHAGDFMRLLVEARANHEGKPCTPSFRRQAVGSSAVTTSASRGLDDAPLVARTTVIEDPGSLIALLPAESPLVVGASRRRSGGLGRDGPLRVERRRAVRRRRSVVADGVPGMPSSATKPGCRAAASSPSARSRTPTIPDRRS